MREETHMSSHAWVSFLTWRKAPQKHEVCTAAQQTRSLLGLWTPNTKKNKREAAVEGEITVRRPASGGPSALPTHPWLWTLGVATPNGFGSLSRAP